MYQFLLKRKLNKFYKNYTRNKRFLNLSDIHNILVLFDTADYEEADSFVEKLEKLEKNVTAYAYKDKLDKYDYSETSYHIITAKDANDLFDNKMNDIAEELKEKEFHLVIDLTIKRNISLEYLLAHANALLKAGLKKNNFPQYDLAITNLPETEKESLKVRELGKQIIYYLHTIHA
jgi:hypothetical protein